MDVFDIDAYSPAQMAARVEKAGITKGNMDPLSTLILAMLAGAFIAFGAALYTFVLHDTTLTLGLSRLLGGLVFCLGLILVIVAGAELFTGNNLIVMAYVSRKVTGRQLLQNWVIVFIGNLLGALIIVLFIYLSNHLKTAGGALSLFALKIAVSKVNLTFMEALVRGILCNLLVCLAVWLCFSGRSVTDKILAILFPITAFVAMGFEHCVANMYFIPAGLVIANDSTLLDSALKLSAQPLAMDNLTTGAFLWNNLLPVTLGNMIGGVFFVGAVYWFVYLRRSAAEPLRNIMTKGPPAVAPDTPIAEAVRVMQARNSSSVLVGKLGESLGIVGEGDIVKKAVAQGMNTDTTPVSAIMSTPLISVDIKTTIYGVYRLLAEQRIRHVVITEEGKQVGFISVKDLLRRPLI
ncbi:MAG TPA: formate/nitrite family transporter [Gammaproteobacteria bacterium]|nr:formate/nitrite family transporter [Gammaproteobacteria bacterium]